MPADSRACFNCLFIWGGGPQGKELLDIVGSTRVIYRQYSIMPPDGVRRGDPSPDITFSFVNESHAEYKGDGGTQLEGPDSRVTDADMYLLLTKLKDVGYFNYGESIGSTDPHKYIGRLARKPFKWIAVNYNGVCTVLVRDLPPPVVAPEREDAFRKFEETVGRAFIESEMAVIDASRRQVIGRGSAGRGDGPRFGQGVTSGAGHLPEPGR